MTMNALKMRLIRYSAHPAARPRKKGCHRRLKMLPSFHTKSWIHTKDDLLYLRVINSSHGGFSSWFTAKILNTACVSFVVASLSRLAI